VTPALSETDLLHLFITRAPHALSVRVFRRNIINVEAKQGFRARNGIAGQADAYALARGGRHIELETKAARGTLAKAQRRWRAWCADWGVPHLVLRAARGEAPEVTVSRWVEELRVACAPDREPRE
jgi:hypothetical protein